MLELAHPHVLDIGEDELAGLALGDVLGFEVGNLGPPLCLRLGADAVVGVGVDQRVVDTEARRASERCALLAGVLGIKGDEANEIMGGVRLIVGNVEQARVDGFAKAVEVGARWLADDCGELRRRFGEGLDDVLGR